ncbi:hypothetical protein AW14_03255 [Siansivirga zeaxanthinifaciens CC-SAMT-1]|uniref:Uncharacterized protein n=2 Tax=Siansivirga TaxID=1204360 RepID=A0A0C5WHY0_9FLAO|nr:hypothetical protein AW14_03255 [Siansivirga zeaxanthinifaciens CC-SAMT-1]
MGFSKDKLLVFTKSARYKYQSIENAIKTIETLGYQNNFEVIQTEQDFKQHLFGVILHRMYH